MKIDISSEDFEKFSNERKKRYIAQLFIRKSGAQPVAGDDAPIAYVMAGLPGAGKTEFLDSFVEEAEQRGIKYLRIDSLRS